MAAEVGVVVGGVKCGTLEGGIRTVGCQWGGGHSRDAEGGTSCTDGGKVLK